MWVIGGGTTLEDVRATHRTGPKVGSERHHGVLGWREVLGLVSMKERYEMLIRSIWESARVERSPIVILPVSAGGNLVFRRLWPGLLRCSSLSLSLNNQPSMGFNPYDL